MNIDLDCFFLENKFLFIDLIFTKTCYTKKIFGSCKRSFFYFNYDLFISIVKMRPLSSMFLSIDLGFFLYILWYSAFPLKTFFSENKSLLLSNFHQNSGDPGKFFGLGRNPFF